MAEIVSKVFMNHILTATHEDQIIDYCHIALRLNPDDVVASYILANRLNPDEAREYIAFILPPEATESWRAECSQI